MTIREQMEERELEYLSPYATLSKNSKGRKIKEEECDIRPVFQRDRDRIVHCKASPQTEAEDPGVSSSKRRSLPYKADTYTGGVTKCKNNCESTPA